MAILNGLEVTVQVDDENVEEFEDPDDNAEENGTFETTKYVEAKSGSSFALSFRVPAAYRMISPCLTFRYAVDDKDYGGAIATNDQQRDRFGDIVLVRKGDMSHSGKRIEMRPFVFSEINIVEDGATRSVRMMKPDYLKVLGTIKCEVFRTKITRVHSKEEYIASLRNQVKTSMPVNTTEKQIKGQALSHSSQLGHGVQSDLPNMNSVDYVDGRDRPIATFLFKYRSKRALKSLLIMPRTPTPQPLEERDVDTLNPAELRELLNHYKANAQPTKAEQVKTERRRGIKRERDEELEAMLATSTSKRVNNRPFRDGEIVELD